MEIICKSIKGISEGLYKYHFISADKTHNEVIMTHISPQAFIVGRKYVVALEEATK